MASVTSASTVAEIEAAYVDNGSYVEDQSVTKCRAFITAARALLIKLPTVATKGANSLSYRVESVQRELERAQAWLEARDTTGDDMPGPARSYADFRSGW